MIFYIIIKNKFTTSFMQSLDVFENFKFIGEIVEAEADINIPLVEVLYNVSKRDTEKIGTVGIIIPNKQSLIYSGHKVISNGNNFSLLSDLCEHYNAPLVEVETYE